MSRGRRIARIKLVHPSPETREKYLLEWDNRALYQNPGQFTKLTAQNLFRRPGSPVLEVGCGTGEFLIASAQARPADLFVGVDISRRVVYHAVHQAAQLGLENIKFIKADIRLLFPLMVPDTWSEVHLIFPDPNYATGRKKHRVFSPDFLDACAGSLAPGGTVSVVTDQFPLLEDMLTLVEADGRFVRTHPQDYLEGFSPSQKTRFQHAWERFERRVYRFELRAA